jgi:hypothetical protein
VAKRGGEQPGLARSLVMLLANLTQVDSGVAALLQVAHCSFSQIKCKICCYHQLL